MIKLIQIYMRYKVLHVLCLLAVQRAKYHSQLCENWLRTPMLQSRFSNLAVVNIENENITNTIDTDQVIDKFASTNRKIPLQI